MGHCICLHAQNIDQATAEYRQFVQLSNSGNQAQMYDALYKCYNSTLAVLEKICAVVEADFGDIMEYIPEEKHD